MSSKKIVAIVVSLLLVIVALFVLYMNIRNDDSSTQVNTSKACTTYGDRVEKQCIDDYVGLTQDAAINKALQHGYNPKIVSIDGVDQAITDEGSAPVYLNVKNGSVVGGYFEGGRKAN